MLPTDPCDVPTEPTDCTGLFSMGEAILETVLGALDPYDDPDICGACAGIDGFVAHGEPQLDFEAVNGAHVTVYLQQFGPTSTSAGVAARAANPAMVPLTMEASWRIEMREACYPGVQGETADDLTFPTAEQYHEVNRHLYAHGYSAYTAVLAAYRNGTLFPDAYQCPTLRFGMLLPIPPQAYIAGWSWDISGEVP